MKRTSRKGFTLIELIVTIVILGILAALAVPAFQAVIERSKKNSLAQGANAIAREAHALAAFDQAAPKSVFEFDSAGAVGADAEIKPDLPEGMTVTAVAAATADDAATTHVDESKGDMINVTDGVYQVTLNLGTSAGVYSAISGGDVVAK